MHDCCLCEIENCAVCALYPVCVGCKTNDDGGRFDGFDIQGCNLEIIDCNGVLQEHGWACGGCAFIENPQNKHCNWCGLYTRDQQHYTKEELEDEAIDDVFFCKSCYIRDKTTFQCSNCYAYKNLADPHHTTKRGLHFCNECID